ncbi:MAG TPA: DUF2207 domain-containing protein, partial [Deinococcales bacterium]|nr:DUF2207 domain-containing protein [Deinococcales bacterium]
MRPSWAAALTLAALLAGAAGAKSYRFERIEQEVRLQPNGTVSVTDTSVYDFSGSFSNGFIEVVPRSGGRMILQGVTAPDGKGVSDVRQEGNAIRWRFSAQDEKRTFRVAYTLTGELDVASDVALFDRQVLEGEHAPVDSYRLRIVAPQAAPENFRVFIFTGRGRIGQLSFDEARRTATVTLPQVSENEPVRAKVFLPSEAFTYRTIQGERLERWLAETTAETESFRRASEEAVRRGDAGGASLRTPPPPTPLPLLVLPWLAVATFAYWLRATWVRYGREPAVEEVGRYYREPAEEIPPAVVPFVMSQRNPGLSAAGAAIGSTLLDFARRGHLELIPHENAGFLGLGRSTETRFKPVSRPDGMTNFEADLWAVMERAGGRDGIVSPDELRRYFKSRPSWGQNWVQEPRAWYESNHGFLVDQAALNATRLPLVLSFLAAAAAIGGGILLAASSDGVGPPVDLVLSLIAAGAVLLVASIVAAVGMPRWTGPALLNARRWQAYRNFLADFSQMETAPAEHYKLWDYHFVYATA